MGRVVLSVPVLVAVVGGVAAAACAQAATASAAPITASVAAPVAAKAAASKAVCTVTDRYDRLTEISGMVATSTGYVVVNGAGGPDSHRKIFFLDSKCKYEKSVPYTSRDPQDVTQTSNGTIWVADIGDSGAGERRSSIAIWKLSKDASRPTIYRMRYPDGPHNAGALLLAGDGTPIIVTKTAGKAGVYAPSAPLAKGKTVALKKVGDFTPPKTSTSNSRGLPGRKSVTGGANAPDGSKVVLRTYADAFEFDVADGKVVEAITKGTPRITPLPDEPRGEAITYSADGKSFLTVSATDEAKILRYAPAVAEQKSGPEKVAAGAGKTDGRSWFDKLTLSDITYMIGGVGVLGLLLVGVGVFGIVRARRRPPGTGAAAADGSPSGPLSGRAQAPPVSPMPAAGQGYQPSEWDWQPPAGTDHRSGTEYRSGSAGRGSGGEYRSSRAVKADVNEYGPPEREGEGRARRQRGSAGRGGVYGTPAQRPAQRPAQPGGTVYGGGSAGGSQYSSSNQYDPPYDYADQEPRY